MRRVGGSAELVVAAYSGSLKRTCVRRPIYYSIGDRLTEAGISIVSAHRYPGFHIGFQSSQREVGSAKHRMILEFFYVSFYHSSYFHAGVVTEFFSDGSAFVLFFGYLGIFCNLFCD